MPTERGSKHFTLCSSFFVTHKWQSSSTKSTRSWEKCRRQSNTDATVRAVVVTLLLLIPCLDPYNPHAPRAMPCPRTLMNYAGELFWYFQSFGYSLRYIVTQGRPRLIHLSHLTRVTLKPHTMATRRSST